MVTLLSMGVTTFFVMLFTRDTLVGNVFDDLILDARLVSYLLENPNEWQLVEGIQRLGDQIGRRIILADYDGAMVADSKYPLDKANDILETYEFKQALNGEVGTARRNDPESNHECLYVTLPYEHGVVVISTIIDEITTPLSNLTTAAIILTAFVSLLALGVTYSVNRNITDPLDDMLAVTKHLQKGEFGRRVLVRSTDEIGQLGRAFNDLSLTLEEMFTTLHDRENKLNAILTSMDDGVVAVDPNLQVILANRAVAEMINEDKNGLIGKDLIDVIRSYQLIEVVTDAMERAKSLEAEIKLYPNSSRIIAIISSPLEGENDNIIGAVIVLRDVTALRRLENIRKEFVANVSHELRTPLTSIKGFVETILNGKTNDPELIERFLPIVNSETDRMIGLINDLLDLSRIESGKQKMIFEKVNIRDLFMDTIAVLESKAQAKNIILENRMNDVEIMGDAKLLRQVAMNLVDNAIKYNKEGGHVWIETVLNDGIVEVSVNDTGFGIPPDDLDRIFERFYRIDKGRSRQMGGTGLGLSIVKHIVDKHSGEIYAESDIDQGSKITFTLKLVNKSEVQQ